MPRPTGVLVQVYSLKGSRFMPESIEVSNSGPLAQWLLPCTHSCGICCFMSALAQVAGLVLSLQVSLVWISFHSL